MDLELQGRVAVVTGASAGIGRGTAKVLAREGAAVVVVARREPLLQALADEMAAEGLPRPVIVAGDLQERPQVASIASRALAAAGRVDILVNNAGGSRMLPVDAADDLWDEAFSLNFDSVRRLTQAFLPSMRAQRWGRILNITGSLEPRSVNGANAAKAAVHAWAKGLACDVAAEGVTVNCLMPGRIHSEQIDGRLHPTAESRDAFIRANIPAGYFGEPEDMAHVIAFLCSPKARYVTGQRLYVDGGMHRSI